MNEERILRSVIVDEKAAKDKLGELVRGIEAQNSEIP